MADEATVLKADDEKRFLLLVAYSPNRMPSRGADGYVDVVSKDTLEKAAWRFMQNGAKAGLWHESGHDNAAQVVENGIYRGPDWTIKAADGSSQTVRDGDWLVGFVLDEPTWALYKEGKIGGASPQGRARRKLASASTLANLRS